MPRNTNEFNTKLTLIHRRIADWYKLHGRRELPWRTAGDPYHVYISEVMLQQTQVKTVLERYYFPFLARFSTLAALAAAPTQDVMKAWEGLGYYTRARNLHVAAQQALEMAASGAEEFYTTTSDQGGAQPQRRLSAKYTLPDTVERLLALPGIGRNTAHAVACFGFGKAVPVMEANVKRVLARVFAMKTLDEKQLWQHAEALLDTQNPFDYNQAMMDVGAMVCTKRAPRCHECPLSPVCKGRAEPEAYPAPKAAKQVKLRERNILVLQDAAGRVLVQKRATRFLGGLWGFLEYEKGNNTPEFNGKLYELATAERLGQVQQVYSHFTLLAQVFRAQMKGKAPAQTPDLRLIGQAELGQLPLSRADAKVVALLTAYMPETI